MLARLTLHPPMDGPLCLGATLCGTVDFSASQEAASADPSLPKCIQVCPSHTYIASSLIQSRIPSRSLLESYDSLLFLRGSSGQLTQLRICSCKAAIAVLLLLRLLWDRDRSYHYAMSLSTRQWYEQKAQNQVNTGSILADDGVVGD